MCGCKIWSSPPTRRVLACFLAKIRPNTWTDEITKTGDSIKEPTDGRDQFDGGILRWISPPRSVTAPRSMLRPEGRLKGRYADGWAGGGPGIMPTASIAQFFLAAFTIRMSRPDRELISCQLSPVPDPKP